MNYRKLWASLAIVIVVSFAVLIYYGNDIYQEMPPLPEKVIAEDGTVLFTKQEILDGQNVWQSAGGQQMGTVWGHGAYVAPDWSADWLHREAVWLLEQWAQERFGRPYEELAAPDQGALRARLQVEMRTNTHNPDSGELTVSKDRAAAVRAVAEHYKRLFSDAPELAELREAYAIPSNVLRDPERRHLITAFFFWASWSCAANRPGENISYTQNWPPDRLVGNVPTGSSVIWSVVSFVLLLAGIGALAWYYAVLKHKEEGPHEAAEHDPLLALRPTPSMRATLKYFWVVAALIVTQVMLGVVTAHYGVEGSGFYGIPLAEWLPYAVTRTWHTQLAIFWIATAWLATGLFIAPAVSGYEPRFQRAGVNFLFICLLIIVVGSMYGTWAGTRQEMGFEANFWFGHQGYEYVDLGRFWQIFLFVGLWVWLLLMARAMWPAFRQPSENRHLLALFLIASTAIALFYGAGLMWGRQTHYAMAEYWRWWVVHLWVEGFFEVFATVVIVFLFTRMGLLRTVTATAAVLFSTTIFLSGGIVGTFHHLYFSGTPTAVMALGATFSALEVVPLVLIGFEAYENLTLSRARKWVSAYRWPIYCFVAVAFWNLVGAGLFGFLINPPIALYYMQGLNTTAVHGHTALFGVYGMLGIGLMLFCLKGLTVRKTWRTGPLAFAFWFINIGLALMVLLSDLPRGLMQTVASVNEGMWWARSADFMQTGIMETFRWLRVIGDTIFGIGVVVLGWFVLGIKTGWSLTAQPDAVAEEFSSDVSS
ncbi:MAG TPA: nitric-oxide reductase large subunit [Candidatus Paceibacterota bacterium]|nr:nitric-oxide reductase large subunit [Verrucomicrobiota bacterium]HSA11344.1 nitric-oxide reductase large subunit [Candidatus Paceibacterota bacterium]